MRTSSVSKSGSAGEPADELGDALPGRTEREVVSLDRARLCLDGCRRVRLGPGELRLEAFGEALHELLGHRLDETAARLGDGPGEVQVGADLDAGAAVLRD